MERLERSLFSNIVLAHDGAQLGALGSAGDGGEPPAGFDRRELTGVAECDHFGADQFCVGEQRGGAPGGSHARLVDDQNRVRVETAGPCEPSELGVDGVGVDAGNLS